jgi:hypothetical protein
MAETISSSAFETTEFLSPKSETRRESICGVFVTKPS